MYEPSVQTGNQTFLFSAFILIVFRTNRVPDWTYMRLDVLSALLGTEIVDFRVMEPCSLVGSCQYVGFEVLTAVVMKSTTRIFWDITPCAPLKVNRRLGETYRLHLQVRRISRARTQPESRWQAELILRPWRWRWYVPPKRRLTFNGLHRVVSQKILLFRVLVCLSETSTPEYTPLWQKRPQSNWTWKLWS
jgi:hypothetical protein